MSSMLKQAIIDAQELKEAAQTSAQEEVIERYQGEIKKAVDKILEQEDPMAGGPFNLGGDLTGADMGMPAPAPLEEEEVELDEEDDDALQRVLEQLPFSQTTDDSELVEINLDKLEEALDSELDEEIELDEELEDLLDEEKALNEIEPNPSPKVDEDERFEESLEDSLANIEESVLQALLEDDDEDDADEDEDDDDDADGGDGKDDGKGDAPAQEAISRQDKFLIKEQKQLNNKVTLLEQKLNQYNRIIPQLKQKLEESNLHNAVLLYQNRVLNSVSLSERQKDKIVESISNAKTVEEAKIIYKTLQSAVGSLTKKHKVPESLSEVVAKRSSAFLPRKEEKKVDPFTERMKILAGIKNN